MLIDKISLLKNRPVCLTLGSFDGLHKGHFKLLKQLKDISRRSSSESLLVSFYPHPRKIINTEPGIRLLNTKEEKIKILSDNGIDLIYFIDFTKELSLLDFDEFYKKYIFERLNVKHIIIGSDHSFGKNRAGNRYSLSRMCKERSAGITVIEPYVYEGVPVSSTRIRNELKNGSVEKANEMLGYDYFLSGKIMKGSGIGTKLGFPTANLDINGSDKVIPAQGVYFSETDISGKRFYSLTNAGYNPTVNKNILSVEAHIPGINKDMYNEILTVSFIKKIREEKKFRSPEDLKKQIENDLIKFHELKKEKESRK